MNKIQFSKGTDPAVVEVLTPFKWANCTGASAFQCGGSKTGCAVPSERRAAYADTAVRVFLRKRGVWDLWRCMPCTAANDRFRDELIERVLAGRAAMEIEHK